jgi:hypothetical protein
MSNEQVYAEINAHIAKCGGGYQGWYAGIAANPRDRLFAAHAVRENADSWIYRTCDTSDGARTVEQALHTLGAKGGPGGGDSDTKSVYAYKIASHTVE